jgi:hypothetical protein
VEFCKKNARRNNLHSNRRANTILQLQLNELAAPVAGEINAFSYFLAKTFTA